MVDDAILSLGQHMSTLDDVTVITVFAGAPESGGFLSDYDKACGFETSRQAIERRRHEDKLACASLDAEAIHWDFWEYQYGSSPNLVADITAAIAKIAASAETLFVPLGLGHPDHRMVARCTRWLDRMLYVYEELPYRVDYPEEAHRRLEEIRDRWNVDAIVAPLERGDIERKKQAICRYVSQFPAGADNPAMLVSERAWRCW